MDGDHHLSCDLSTMQGATIIRPSGVLTVRTYAQLRDALLKCAAAQPRAVIADLDALEIARDYLTTVFVTVWLRVSRWSAVPLIVVPGTANAVSFTNTPADRFLTVRPTVLDALAQLDGPAPRQRTELWLPPSANSVRAARRFVTDTCHNWSIPAVTTHAVTVAGELVANAALHTTSPARLRLELRQRRLTVAVTDDDPRPVRLPRPGDDPGGPHGGLHLVTHLAVATGCSHRQSGGKVVWAVLRVPDA
ncbi:ATP-binding protein [Amycolatopsis solani]|uniref:ATP-binding protein n=1 Tax=Amycolatopsis solani TaxID=3028615 RepID=UPI0025B21622|nr:ATP-binding protein [Amycolatopsis sp. MEP2-6]